MFFKRKEKTFSFECSECGEIHSGSPSLFQKRPASYLDVPKSDREDLSVVSDDLCIVFNSPDKVKAEATYSIRTILEIPIQGAEEPMLLGVWVTQSHESFQNYVETFDGDQSDYNSFGWLQVNQPHYLTYGRDGFLMSVGCDVIGQKAGSRPKIFLHPTDHELFHDQQNGISWAKAEKIYKLWVHS